MNTKNPNNLNSPFSLTDIINGLIPPQPPMHIGIDFKDEDPHDTALLVGQAAGTVKDVHRLLELVKNLSPGYNNALPKLHRLHLLPFGRKYHVEFAAMFPLRKARLLAHDPWPTLKPYINSINCIYPLPKHEAPLLTGLDCEIIGLTFTCSVSGQFGPVLKEIIRKLPFGWALVSGEKPIREGDEFPEAYVEILFPQRKSMKETKRAMKRKQRIVDLLEHVAQDQKISGYIYHREPSSTVNQVMTWIP
jgi:hypothetical protein